MDDPQRFTPAEAADPSTPGEVLAAIAGSRPDLRPYVAANPAAYPGLLEWLSQLGDPAVDGALQARGQGDAIVHDPGLSGDAAEPDADRTAPEPGPGRADVPTTGEPVTHQTVAYGTEGDEAAEAPSALGRHAAPGPGEAGETPGGEGVRAGWDSAAPYDESGRGAGAYVPPAGDRSGGAYAPPGAPPGYSGGEGYPAGPGGQPHQDQSGPGPAAYGPYGAPGGEPPKKNRTWLWVLLGLLALFVIGGIVIAVLVWQGIQRAAEDGGDFLNNGNAQSYGDDAALDSLWDSCEGGDMGACDELYRESPIDSEYEEFGDTCGGRTDGGVWCEDLAEEGASTEPGDRSNPAIAWA